MGFETRVLQEIQPLLQAGGEAEFSNGTLFVRGIDATTALAVRELIELAFTVSVEVAGFRGAREWAFDFVADPARYEGQVA